MKTGFYTNPIYLEHDTGSHPENANRLRAIQDLLISDGLVKNLEVQEHKFIHLLKTLKPHGINAVDPFGIKYVLCNGHTGDLHFRIPTITVYHNRRCLIRIEYLPCYFYIEAYNKGVEYQVNLENSCSVYKSHQVTWQ